MEGVGRSQARGHAQEARCRSQRQGAGDLEAGQEQRRLEPDGGLEEHASSLLAARLTLHGELRRKAEVIGGFWLSPDLDAQQKFQSINQSI